MWSAEGVKIDMQHVVDTMTDGFRQEIGLNYFYATGMTTQEIRHSNFLAFLLDPQQAHGLGSAMLCRLLEKLYTMPTPSNQQVCSNMQILDSLSAGNCMQAISTAQDIQVYTERSNANDAKRKDILILSNSCKTTITIENKTFSSTHDDQLHYYQEDIDSGYNPSQGWCNIMVYLSPKGSIPINQDGSYAQQWCILDYTSIKNICTDIVADIKVKTLPCSNKTKLETILGDYIEMINTELLENKDVFDLYRTLTKNTDSQRAIDLLVAYNSKDKLVQQYCKQWLANNLAQVGYTIVDNDNKIISMTSTKMDFFLGDNATAKYSCIFLHESYEYKCQLALTSTKKSIWSSQQLHLGRANVARNTTHSTVVKISLINDKELRTKTDNEIVALLSSRLQLFVTELAQVNDKIDNYHQ